MNLKSPATRNPEVDGQAKGSYSVWVCSAGLEGNKLHFVWVNAKAIPQQPVRDSEEAVSTFLHDGVVAGTSGYNCSIVNIGGE